MLQVDEIPTIARKNDEKKNTHLLEVTKIPIRQASSALPAPECRASGMEAPDKVTYDPDPEANRRRTPGVAGL